MIEYIVIFLILITGCESNAFSVTFDPKSIISTTSKQFVGVTLDTGLLRVRWDKLDFRYNNTCTCFLSYRWFYGIEVFLFTCNSTR